MKVTIKRKHIDNGIPETSGSCPIALALQEKHGGVSVECEYVKINSIKLSLPSQARKFIERFDAGKPVKPFAFELKYLV